jgi:spore germination protein YaaH
MRNGKWVLIWIWLVLLISGCQGSQTRDSSLHNSNAIYISGWLANYDTQRGYNSFLDHIGIFNEINPVWYNLNPNYFSAGQSPFINYGGGQSSLLTVAKSKGIKVLPTIQNFGTSNFDPVVIHQIMNDPTFRAKHVSEIVTLVLDRGFDGIDIDYENLYASDRAVFSTFISALGQALTRNGKLLSVTVYAKTTGTESWNGPGAQDWTKLVTQANTLKVMAYDYHWAGFHAGPICPVDWLRDVLAYARTVPEAAGKIVIGLPLYGIDWPAGASGKEIMYNEAMNLVNQGITSPISRSNADHSSNSYCGSYFENVEPHFTYSKNNITHTAYYQDAYALQQRINIISQYRKVVKGLAFWRLGGEDPAGWEFLKQFK